MTRLIFWAGAVVALAAVAATAHGGYAVAVACLVPPGLAWLYPFITDGLALVAYGATSRLARSGRGYAWTIVVTAAALSGLAQAVFLSSGSNLGSSPGHLAVDPWLAFGVGAWPAIAVALVAHLLYLLHRAETHSHGDTTWQTSTSQDTSTPTTHGGTNEWTRSGVTPWSRTGGNGTPGSETNPPTSSPSSTTPPSTATTGPVSVDLDPEWAELDQLDNRGVNLMWETAPTTESRTDPDPIDPPTLDPDPVNRPGKAITRAADAATKHAAENGALPTLSELQVIAGVSRGTAVNAIKQVKATTNGHRR